MTREQRYTEQLKEMGVYQEAFSPEIHMLAMMERELQRMVKDWKAGGSHATSEVYKTISALRKDILAHRDALGLTPKGMHRLRKKLNDEERDEKDDQTTVLQMIKSRRRESA